MDDLSWMYRDSPQGLRRIDYCNGVQGFINFATSIPRNFTGCDIRCPCRKCQNKKYLHPDVVMMHLDRWPHTKDFFFNIQQRYLDNDGIF